MEQGKFRLILNRTLTTVILFAAVIVGISLSKNPDTRTWGVIIAVSSFILLYSYVVQRRKKPRKK